MEKASFKIDKPLYIAGLSVRTNNKNETNLDDSKIANLVAQYFFSGLSAQLQGRQKPGVTYGVYTDYDSDENGDYTYYVGEIVDTPNQPMDELEITQIPDGNYQKFTTDAGPIPDVIINAWQEVHAMGPEQLGGERRFAADFEILDKRAEDLESAIVDICVGIK